MKHLNDYQKFFTTLNEQTETIYDRPGDPYQYKSDGKDWFAKRKGSDTWFNITGTDYKPRYDKSILILDNEFPNARGKQTPVKDDTKQPLPKDDNQKKTTDDKGGILPPLPDKTKTKGVDYDLNYILAVRLLQKILQLKDFGLTVGGNPLLQVSTKGGNDDEVGAISRILAVFKQTWAIKDEKGYKLPSTSASWKGVIKGYSLYNNSITDENEPKLKDTADKVKPIYNLREFLGPNYQMFWKNLSKLFDTIYARDDVYNFEFPRTEGISKFLKETKKKSSLTVNVPANVGLGTTHTLNLPVYVYTDTKNSGKITFTFGDTNGCSPDF